MIDLDIGKELIRKKIPLVSNSPGVYRMLDKKDQVLYVGKAKKQKIKFNIVIDVNQNTLPNEKDLRSIINYEKITKKLESLVKNKKYNFLESLAEDSFVEIFKDKRINSVKIKIEKPDAIKNAGSAGVEIFKSRSDYERS